MKKKRINTYMQFLEDYVPCFCKHNIESYRKTESFTGTIYQNYIFFLKENIELAKELLNSKECSFYMDEEFKGFSTYLIRSEKAFFEYLAYMVNYEFYERPIFNNFDDVINFLFEKYNTGKSFVYCSKLWHNDLLTPLYKATKRTKIDKIKNPMVVDIELLKDLKYYHNYILESEVATKEEKANCDEKLVSKIYNLVDYYYGFLKNNKIYMEYDQQIKDNLEKIEFYKSLHQTVKDRYNKLHENDPKYKSYTPDISFWGSHYSDD